VGVTLLHCTQKILKELGTPPLVDPSEIPTNPEGIGNWYANLLRIDRRKCLMFTNEKTLFTFLVPGVMKQNLQNIHDEFLISLNLNLQSEGFSLEVITKVLQEHGEIGFAKTANKHVLGSMNDFVIQYEFLIMRDGGLDNLRRFYYNRAVNRTPMGALGYKNPLEVLKEMLMEGDD